MHYYCEVFHEIEFNSIMHCFAEIFCISVWQQIQVAEEEEQ